MTTLKLTGEIRQAPERQKATSCRPLSISGESKTGTNVLRSKVWKVGEYFIDRHPGGKILKNILDGHPQPTDARLPAAFVRLNRN
jgi:hypothetical protein